MAQGEGNHVTVDIQLIPSYRMLSMKKISSNKKVVLDDYMKIHGKSCIFKTPNILCRHNEDAYLPDAFSIGPWHVRENHLKATQKIKVKYLEDLIDRFPIPSPSTKLAELEAAVREVKAKAKECYGSLVGVSDEDFIKILVLDGCFIIEFLRKNARVVGNMDDEGEPILDKSCMIQFLYHDLILLENQIPWFVLEILFNKTTVSDRPELPLQALVIMFFSNVFPCDLSPEILSGEEEIVHIIDLLRKCLVSPLDQEGGDDQKSETVHIPFRIKLKKAVTKYIFHTIKKYLVQPFTNCLVFTLRVCFSKSGDQPEEPEAVGVMEGISIHSATRLKEAGIVFKRAASRSILDIRFDERDGVLEIPPLLIKETTETILRNLISFEQCYYKCRSHPKITCYAKLLDDLIDTVEDMQILCDSGIIVNWLNPVDATEFFNSLYSGTYMDEFYYHDLCKQVNGYCQKWWPKWRAFFIQNYFVKPWAVIAIIYAFIMLALTVLQVANL